MENVTKVRQTNLYRNKTGNLKKNWTGDNKSTQGEQTGRETQMKLKEKNENNSYE